MTFLKKKINEYCFVTTDTICLVFWDLEILSYVWWISVLTGNRWLIQTEKFEESLIKGI